MPKAAPLGLVIPHPKQGSKKGFFTLDSGMRCSVDLYLLIQGPFYCPLLGNMSKNSLLNILVF